ncbi:beta strand repeat-containing protein [uncultured Nostoc sp.]|uniref:beta strand repeat-containing protein n=1 Tax=uncultured Nostoc sp. TaxID=340711 RepID=UPI0035C9F5AD
MTNIMGTNGNDTLFSSNDADTINGKAGNDTLDVEYSTGNNTLIGGTGNDTLNAEYSTGDNTLNGSPGNDMLRAKGSKGDNLLSGGDGNDFLDIFGDFLLESFGDLKDFVSTGNNTLNGGSGNDTLGANGSKGDNLLSGGDGNDNISISGRLLTLFSNAGNSDSDSVSTGNNTLNGGAGNDTLSASGSTGENLLSGGTGNDFLDISGAFSIAYRTNEDSRSKGNNTLNGGSGNDTLKASGSIGDNLLSGGDGNDFLDISGDFLLESFGDLKDSVSTGNNTLNGGSGNDTLKASGSIGDNLLDGGTGDDLLFVDYKNATGGIATTFNATTKTGSITAGTSRISYKNIERFNILGTAFDDNIVGNSGNDTLSTGSGGKDTIDGGKGDDFLFVDYTNATGGIATTFNATTNIGLITAGTSGISYKNIEQLNILGTAYNDNIVGTSGNDTLSTGSGGKDTIDGSKGNDLLFADYTNATGGIATTFSATTNIGLITAGTSGISYKNIEQLNILGTAYNDNIVGTSGNDTLSMGSGGKDTIDGGKGDDLLSVDYRNATGKITSTFNATTKTGLITAGTSGVSYKNIERLNISGTTDNDNIVGTSGNDTLYGGNGNDTLYGGDGIDTFVFNEYYQNVDSLYDFNATNEVIQVLASSYYESLGGLSPGTLLATQFTIGTSATTSEQRFIYNSATGGLFLDVDGSASGFTQLQFAQLSAELSLTNNNFVVV